MQPPHQRLTSPRVVLQVRAHETSSDELTCPECAVALAVSDVHALTWRCGDDETWARFEAAADGGGACARPNARQLQPRRGGGVRFGCSEWRSSWER
jgi:hypothetical protein